MNTLTSREGRFFLFWCSIFQKGNVVGFSSTDERQAVIAYGVPWGVVVHHVFAIIVLREAEFATLLNSLFLMGITTVVLREGESPSLLTSLFFSLFPLQMPHFCQLGIRTRALAISIDT